MSNLKMQCRTATPFKDNGEFDEDAFRKIVTRLARSNVGLYLASGGLGEAFAMSTEEIRRLYEVAVEECKGKVPVYANPPEQHTPSETIRHAVLAAEAGCDAVNIYPTTGWHGYRPTEEELHGFFDAVLPKIKIPVILAANPVVGYVPSARVMAETINRHPNVIGLNINNDERYLVNVKDIVKRDIDYYCPLLGFLNSLAIGATGMISHEANIIPKSFRSYLDLCQKKDFAALAPLNSGLLRYKQLVERWYPGNARPTKMVMKVLKMPGGNGVLRPPNMLPGADQLKLLAEGLLKVGLPEIDELASAAGLR